MAVTLGQLSVIGVGEEATWGTAVARAKWLAVQSTSLHKKTIFKPRPHLGYNGAAANVVREMYVEAEDSDGAIEVQAQYDNGGFGMLLAHAMGMVADAGGGSPYTHTFTLKGPNDSSLVGLTIEQLNGEEDAEVFEGCLIGGFELTVEAGKPAMLKLPNIIAETSGGLTTQGSPTFDGAAEAVDYDDFGAISWNGYSFTPISFTVKVTRPFERRRRVGSTRTAKPVVAGPITVEITAVVEHGDSANTAALETAFHAGTAADWTITATGGTSPNAFAITGHNAQVVEVSRPVNGPGVIRKTIKWVCKADSSDMGLAIVITNGEATYKT